MVTDVGSTDGLDNEDAVPADGAVNPPDEDHKTDDSGQTPSQNKKLKLKKKSAGMRRERTRSRTRVAQPNKDKVQKPSWTLRPLNFAVRPDGFNQKCHFKYTWHDISHENNDA